MANGYRSGFAWLLVLALAVQGCDDEEARPLEDTDEVAVQDDTAAVIQQLVQCPVSVASEDTATATPQDGVELAVAGHRLSIPPQGVSAPTPFVLREEASQYLKVWAGPRSPREESEEQFAFQPRRPATLAISYQRCQNAAELQAMGNSLVIVRLNPNDQPLPDNLNSEHVADSMYVRTDRDTLSPYAIATN